jgi:hypothetical protein
MGLGAQGRTDIPTANPTLDGWHGWKDGVSCNFGISFGYKCYILSFTLACLNSISKISFKSLFNAINGDPLVQGGMEKLN